MKDFLDPEVLDSLALKTNEVMKVMLCCVPAALCWVCSEFHRVCFFSSGSESEAGVSGEVGVARRDKLGVRRRSCRTVGHVRRRIHVSPSCLPCLSLLSEHHECHVVFSQSFSQT